MKTQGSWIDSLTEEQKRSCGLLPEQMKERFTRQLEILSGKGIVQTKENREVQGALKAAIARLS